MGEPLRTSLVTGGSGFLGGLVAAALLAEEKRRVLLPVRTTTSPADCVAHIKRALRVSGVPDECAEELVRQVTVVDLPGLLAGELDDLVGRLDIDEVVHCAGCVDYFDKELLDLANVDLTVQLLEAARQWRVGRFLYLSTAYCAGYRSEVIREQLHPDPAPCDEPTEYTRSKRVAERRIADSGLPFVIIRPSVVIGDSRTGAYTGKNYGLYQMWRAIEGLLCREYSPVWHTVAPPAPVNLIHQDAFREAFLAIHRCVAADAIVHLTGDHASSPTMRDLCWLWAEVYCPTEIHSYARVDDVPLDVIPRRQRRFLELAAKNLEISTQTWRFETRHLDGLRNTGLAFPDATLETVARCQHRYIESSPRIQEHMRLHALPPGVRPRLIEMFGRSQQHGKQHAASPS